MDNLEDWQGDCCQRHPTAGGRNIMSSLVLPLPALRLSLACREFSTWATDRDLWQRIQNFRLLIFVYFFGQSANTFHAFNRGCHQPIVFKWTEKLVSINPILPVSRSIKEGAGDIQTPSLSKTENKFSTRRQSWSKWLKVVATRTKTSRLKIVTSRTKNLI